MEGEDKTMGDKNEIGERRNNEIKQRREREKEE
jgi:hypothetical protein